MFEIFFKKDYIIVYLNKKIFFKQEYINNKQYTFFFVLLILHKYGMEVID